MTQKFRGFEGGIVAVLVALVAGTGIMDSEAYAGPILPTSVLYDPDGAGGGDAVDIAGLDWAPGNAVAIGGNQAVSNFINGTGPTTFEVLYQASLVGYIDTNGSTMQPDGIRAGSYEITAVARFVESVASVDSSGSSAVASFRYVNDPGAFFEIWFDATPNSDNSTGTGFRDGVKILEGFVSFAAGNFEVTSTDPVPLDSRPGAGGGDGQLSVSGIGGTVVTVAVTDYDSSFFQSDFSWLFFNTSNKLPYRETAPSKEFFNGVIPDLGTINGLREMGPQGGGPDIEFQSDANNSFAVPEPGSITLIALGLAGVLACGRKRIGSTRPD